MSTFSNFGTIVLEKVMLPYAEEDSPLKWKCINKTIRSTLNTIINNHLHSLEAMLFMNAAGSSENELHLLQTILPCRNKNILQHCALKKIH